MKKNLVLLTGIVFVITILLAGGCGSGNKQELVADVENESTTEESKEDILTDSTKVKIYLKDSLIDGRMHLEMYEERDSCRRVINDLVTYVYPGYTVKWRKASKSNINKVEFINIKEVYGTEFSDSVRLVGDSHQLEIPCDAKTGIIIYEIHFTVKDHKDTIYIIDPYLRIPPGSGGTE
ncbi:MAG: hypothetical protein KAR17_01945 [Cyclobacteriaceae bacterium]|nr:hypothetical protein [Cyclobacteriaceae bacterium]